MNAPERWSKRFTRELKLYSLREMVVGRRPRFVYLSKEPASHQVSEWFKKAISILQKPAPRPLIILMTALAILYLTILTLTEFNSVPPPFDKVIQVNKLSDRVLGPVLLALLVAPFAFIVWCFRDANTQQQIATQRKDILLKEFETVQERATDESNVPMQVAAISQLRAFLNKEFIDAFQRPAWDMIRALLQQYDPWNQKPDEKHLCHFTDYRAVFSDWLSFYGKTPLDPEGPCFALEKKIDLISSPQWRALSTLINEEAKRLFRYKLPHSFNYYSGINFTNVKFRVGESFANALMTGTNFNGTKIQEANFQGAQLQDASFAAAQLQDANFAGAQLQNANFLGARLQKANFIAAQLQDANFDGAQLQNANFLGARLQKAIFRNTHLQKTGFWSAHMNIRAFYSILDQAYPNDPEGWIGIVCIEDTFG